MRTFLDGEGRRWEVVLGRESWGRVVAILYLQKGVGPVLEAPLEAESYEEARRWLEEMSPEGLNEILMGAVRKDMT